jgi:hypothetical protein
LANQTRRVGLCDLCSTRSASHQIDTIANAPCLLKIESARSSVHLALEILDCVRHSLSTQECEFEQLAPQERSLAQSSSTDESGRSLARHALLIALARLIGLHMQTLTAAALAGGTS